MGEEKRDQGDERPKREEAEPTPIFDAVFSATLARANTPNPSNPPKEPGKAAR